MPSLVLIVYCLQHCTEEDTACFCFFFVSEHHFCMMVVCVYYVTDLMFAAPQHLFIPWIFKVGSGMTAAQVAFRDTVVYVFKI